jgi:PPM family protein phosphatase
VVQHLRPDGAMRTDTGVVRSLNEDSVAFVAPPAGDPAASRGSLMLVADGMGGHAAGEVASALAVETVRRVYYELGGATPEVLAAAFVAAHRAILSWAESNPDCKGMGTTCTALAVRDGQAWLAHIGDSRAYLLRAGVMTQLSDDQTLVAQMVRDGKLTPEQAQNSPINNVILEALGAKEAISPIVWADPLPLAGGDILVLCSDGLSGVVADATIVEHIARFPPAEACDALIETAKAAGAPDNVSVGVFQMVADNGSQHYEQPEPSSGTTRRLKVPREQSTAAATWPPPPAR